MEGLNAEAIIILNEEIQWNEILPTIIQLWIIQEKTLRIEERRTWMFI